MFLALCRCAPAIQIAGNSDPPRACIRVWPEARYRNYGYDHIVHVQNGCVRPATCDVSTNVNHTPIRVLIQPREHRELLTFRGSPSSEFGPRVHCWFD